MILPKKALTPEYSQSNSLKIFKFFEISKDEKEFDEEKTMVEFLQSIPEVFNRSDKNKIMAEFICRLILEESDTYADLAHDILVRDYAFDTKALDKEITNCGKKIFLEEEPIAPGFFSQAKQVVVANVKAKSDHN